MSTRDKTKKGISILALKRSSGRVITPWIKTSAEEEKIDEELLEKLSARASNQAPVDPMQRFTGNMTYDEILDQLIKLQEKTKLEMAEAEAKTNSF